MKQNCKLYIISMNKQKKGKCADLRKHTGMKQGNEVQYKTNKQN